MVAVMVVVMEAVMGAVRGAVKRAVRGAVRRAVMGADYSCPGGAANERWWILEVREGIVPSGSEACSSGQSLYCS